MCRNHNNVEDISKIVIFLKKDWKRSQQMILTAHYLSSVVQCLSKSAAHREFAGSPEQQSRQLQQWPSSDLYSMLTGL